MTSRLLNLPIRGENVALPSVDVLIDSNGRVFFVADCDIDADGSGGNAHGDPYFQPDTTYHYNGVALDSTRVPFIVVPKSIVKAVAGIVLGCRAVLTNTRNGRSVECLVGDIGPSFKLGEASIAAAERVGIPSHPVYGGYDDYDSVLYEIYPGVPAVVDGVTYPLQPYRR